MPVNTRASSSNLSFRVANSASDIYALRHPNSIHERGLRNAPSDKATIGIDTSSRVELIIFDQARCSVVWKSATSLLSFGNSIAKMGTWYQGAIGLFGVWTLKCPSAELECPLVRLLNECQRVSAGLSRSQLNACVIHEVLSDQKSKLSATS